MCRFENKWLKDYPHCLKPVFYRRYVDYIFVLLYSVDHSEKFKEYLPSKHSNKNFLLEKIVVSTVPEKDLMIVPPYLTKHSLQISTMINRGNETQASLPNFPMLELYSLLNVN